MTKTEINDYFNAHPFVRVEFTKVNGDVRVMNATRNFDWIPMEFHPKNKEGRDLSESPLVTCFDADIQEWRSFRVESLISLSPSK